MAEFRPALTIGGKSGKEVEIFLYDTLPGGAGFATQIAGRGLEIFKRALYLRKRELAPTFHHVLGNASPFLS
ncbi:hypothetical protein DZD18_11535, partial [Rhodobacteraceae bacterium W635]